MTQAIEPTGSAVSRHIAEALAACRQAALKATEDTENAMMELAQAQAHLEQLQDEVASLTRARDLSEQACKLGAITLADFGRGPATSCCAERGGKHSR